MDYNKLSHQKPAVIPDTINKVKKVFGDISVVRRNKLAFLGMNIDIKDNIIQVDMLEQLEECISIFGEDASTSVLSSETKKHF